MIVENSELQNKICILRQKKMALMTIIYLLKGLPHQNVYAIFHCTENEFECSSEFEIIVFVFTSC